jgi:uncharacterized protein YjbI with pentapeptide repeats
MDRIKPRTYKRHGSLPISTIEPAPEPEAFAERPPWHKRFHRRIKETEPYGILLAVLALVLSLVTFWIDYEDRVQERTVRAWQLLTTPATGNSGKREALEYLNSEDEGICLFGYCIGRKERTPLVGIDLSSMDGEPRTFLQNVDLSNADLSQMKATFANFSNATLRNANLARADLSNAKLWRADLRNAVLVIADLSNAALAYADLSNADFRHADLSNANLALADLSNAYLVDADLSKASLRGADLNNANLYGADLSNANLARADLSNARLARADLSKANLEGANLSNAYLVDADLSNADLSEADLSNADLSEADFRNAYISRVNFANAQNLSQGQLDAAWAFAGDPIHGLETLDPPLAMKPERLCDPDLIDVFLDGLHEMWRKDLSLSFGPPPECNLVDLTNATAQNATKP